MIGLFVDIFQRLWSIEFFSIFIIIGIGIGIIGLVLYPLIHR